MTLKSSLLLTKSLIFPKSEKKSPARKSLLGAVLCIGLSIIPLVVVLSVTTGMINAMTERLIGLSSSHLKAYVSADHQSLETAGDFTEYAEKLLEIDGVTGVYPEVNISALAAGKKIRTGAQIRAVPKNIFSENKNFSELFTFCEGDIKSFENEDSENNTQKNAIIGQKLAEILEIHVGDTFKIITTKSSQNEKSRKNSVVPKLTTFTVSAIVTSGYQELDALWCFIPLETAWKNLSLSNARYNVLIETENAFSPSLSVVQRNVKSYLGKWANVYRWNQVHASEFENFSSTKVMLVFVMILIVLVACINVSSAIIMLTMERRKEIAILKSLGGTSKGITFSFMLAGLACGTAGVIIGIPCGTLITCCINQIINFIEIIVNFFTGFFSDSKFVLLNPSYYLSKVEFEISFPTLILTGLLTMLLSLVVSVIPAIKAGKEKPLETLRKN